MTSLYSQVSKMWLRFPWFFASKNKLSHRFILVLCLPPLVTHKAVNIPISQLVSSISFSRLDSTCRPALRDRSHKGGLDRGNHL